MTVQQLIDADLFELKACGDTKKVIVKVFCCDLLSIAMGKAPADSAWVTVMGNKNTIAVSSLTDTSCIILAEDAKFSEADLACASAECITVFCTSLPVFDAALKVHELIQNSR